MKGSVLKVFDKKYGCGTCGLHFKDREDVIMHVREKHAGKSTFLCITCDESFDSESAFKLHMARDHRI